MNREKKPSALLFRELREKGLIVTSHIIEESENSQYFQAIPPNKIVFNPSMNYLDNNSFMFCLLHEENHNRHPFRTASWFLLSSGILLLIPIFFHYSFESFIAFSIAVIFLGIVLKRKEEYECDEFASISLKNQIKIQEAPSQVIERTLKTMPYQRWWSTLIHPPHNKRVKNIADNVD